MTTTEVRRPEADPTALLSPEELATAHAILSVDTMNEFRPQEYEVVLGARSTYLEQDHTDKDLDQLELELDEVELTTADRVRSEYLAAMGLDPDSAFGLTVKSILGNYSTRNMSAGEWFYGTLKADGTRDSERSGQKRFSNEVESLIGPDPNLPEAPTEPAAPEQTVYDEAVLKLAEKRKELARWNVSLSTQMRKKGDRAKETMRFYKKAEEDYRKAYVAAGDAAVALLQSQGKSEDEIRQAVAVGTVNEFIAETSSVKEILDGDTSRKAKIARWLGRPRNMVISNIIGGSATGFVIGKVLKGAAAVAAAPLAPAVLGFGIAAKTSKGVLQASIGNRASLYSMYDKRSQEDLKAVHANAMTLLGLTGTSAPDINNLAERSATQLTRNYEQRAESNRKYNRDRAVRAAVISGAAAVAAAAAAEYIFDNKSAGVGSRPSRPGTGQVDNPGGGRPSVGEINQPSGTGNVISPERAEFLRQWDGMSPPQQINFIRMMDWQQKFIEQNGLMNDPEKYQKSVKAFVKGVKYMGKLEAARRGA